MVISNIEYAILAKNGIEVWNSYKCTKKVFMFGNLIIKLKLQIIMIHLKVPEMMGGYIYHH